MARRRPLSLSVLTAAALAVGALATAAPAAATAYEYLVPAGTRLVAGDVLTSDNRAFTVTVQTDGNVVERRGATAVWTTNTAGNAGAVLDVQTDGNLVVRSAAGRAVWTSGTPGHRSSVLTLEDSGELQLVAGTAYWTNNVGAVQRRTGLSAGQSVRSTDADSFVVSPSNRFRLQVNASGLALSEVVPNYETGTWFAHGAAAQHVLTMQTDGNLVLRGTNGVAYWSSRTTGAGNRFTVQDDGNLVVRRANGSAAWASGTTRVLIAAGETAVSGSRFVGDRSVRGLGSTTVVQADGNVVSRTEEGRLKWVTGTAGNPGARLMMQTDGNLVVRRPDGRAVWQSGTGRCGAGYAFETAYGGIVKGGTTVWSTSGGSAGYC